MDDRLTAAAEAFRTFWRTGDLDAWGAALSDDVQLLSPIFTATFDGRAEALQLYKTLFESLTDVEVGDVFGSPGGVALPWQATAGSRRIEGVDFLRLDAAGRICEVRVMLRTLVGIAAFSIAVGPSLASRYGVVRALVTRMLTWPLSPAFRALDWLAPRLVKPRPARRP